MTQIVVDGVQRDMTAEEQAAYDARIAAAVAAAAATAAALPQQIADEINAKDDKLKTISEMLWQIAKAANTGNWSAFKLNDNTPVTNRATFDQYVKETYVRVSA